MPIDPDHIYADQPHPRTVQPAEFRYGCHSRKIGSGPRGRTRKLLVQDGWRLSVDGGLVRVALMREVETQWKPIDCGHIAQIDRGADPACAGCENRGF